MSKFTEELTEFVGRTHGRVLDSEFRGWTDHAQSAVWRVLTDASEDHIYLKSFSENRKFQQELNFYQERSRLLPQFPLAKLLDDDPDQRAILLTELAGQPVSTLTLGPVARQDAHRQAGRFLGALHSLPHQDQDIPVVEALEKRCRAWCRRAQGKLASSEIDWVADFVAEGLPLLESQSRVYCHRDFTERNWLFQNGEIAVIDFEHARPDLGLLDFEKLFLEEWATQTDLWEPFWEGYGRTLKDWEREVLVRCSALTALGTISWAVAHGDLEFERRGRLSLERLQDASRSGGSRWLQ